MTLRPVEPQRLQTKLPPELLDELPDYGWRGVCRVPGCQEPATDPHHCVRRSDGGRDWVLIDGAPVPNKVGLCRLHHDLVTTGLAAVTWDDGTWCYRTQDGKVRPLRRQLQQETIEATRATCCPTCGRSWPKPNPFPRRPWRPKREFVMQVPDDEENGTAITHSLLEQAAEILGHAEPENPALHYYVLNASLYDFVSRNGGSKSASRNTSEQSSSVTPSPTRTED